MTAIDFGILSDADGVSVAVSTGDYLVQVKIMSFDGDLGVCRARALPVGFEGSTSAAVCGEVMVDTARVAINDMTDIVEEIIDDDFNAMTDAIDAHDESFGDRPHAEIATLPLRSKTIELTCISSGFGDGSYPAWSLSQNNKVVGIELEFLKDGHIF